MAQRKITQMSLADGLIARREGQNMRLERIDRLIDWSRIEALLAPIYASRRGRKSYPLVCLFKSLVLQQWYGLSDPELEEALADRLSFRRFVGLPLDEAVPDHSTLSRFRARLLDHGLGEALFEEINRQLDAKGLIVRRGTMIDATLVTAQAAAPGPRAADRRSAVDPDADWTRRGAKHHFGYKAHLAVDADSELIRRAVLTPASVNDTEPADDLILGDERAVYADRAYDTHARRARLKAAGIANGIMIRGNKHHPLAPAHAAHNRRAGAVRRAIERTFGTMKRLYRYRCVRYFGLARNALQLHLLCLAINLRRADSLMR